MSTPGPSFLQRISEHFSRLIPHAEALGVQAVVVEAEQVIVRLPVRPEFLGDSERGIVHTGIVTTLIDTVCGLAVLARIGRPDAIATLDLRVDYLRPSVLGADLVCRAECYRLTSQIAFVRASVWQQNEAEPVATSLAAFMRGNAQRGRFT